jgi:integrase
VLRRRGRRNSTTYYARFTDPDTGQEVDENLTRLGLTTEERRSAWAVKKSKALAARAAELASGAPRHTNTSLVKAVDDYFASAVLRDATVENYRAGIGLFLDWCKTHGLTTGDEVFPHHLAHFLNYLKAQPCRLPVQGGKRHERRAEGRLSPTSVNNRLRAAKVVLNELRRLGLLPHIGVGDIKDRLKALRTGADHKKFFKQNALGTLMAAALRHDQDCFGETRDEHAGVGEVGSTRRYDPVAPFVCFVLLTGCRLGEALNIRWCDIDLEEREITLLSAATKTAQERVIDLKVSPALVHLLTVLKLRARDERYVFGGSAPWSRHKVDAARERMIDKFGAPEFRWQELRQTTATYLTNAPAIFPGASAWRSAKQLGHSVQIAERHYAKLHKSISPDAETLDDAMEIAGVLAEIGAEVGGPSRWRSSA